MRPHRHVGLERIDGDDVGRDPRAMSIGELARLGHARVSPLRALRLKCLDCCNGSTREVRLCTAVDCPSWPFRMGRNPWAGPVSEARREHGRRLGLGRPANPAGAFAEKEQIDSSALDGGTGPRQNTADSPKTETDASEEGRR